MRRLLTVGVLGLLVSACGGDTPVTPAPSPPAAIAGGWSGTVQYSTGTGGPFLYAVLFNLTQAGASVNGTYATQTFNGTVSGTTTPSSFSGTMTWQASATGGGACSGSLAVSGTAGGQTMQWTSPGVTSNCTNTPLALTFAMQRQ